MALGYIQSRTRRQLKDLRDRTRLEIIHYEQTINRLRVTLKDASEELEKRNKMPQRGLY